MARRSPATAPAEAPSVRARATADSHVLTDLAGYRELFDRLESIEDPHRRYQAGVRLIEQGLAASATTLPARLPQLFAAVAEGALEMLEREPREPKLLGYAGVALYELWSLDAAGAMFEAAGRLDPRLEQLDRNLAALTQRRRRLRQVRRSAPLHPAISALASRALELAPRAQPVEGLRLSLCMIVRDEQDMLPRCLEAVTGAVDEIVVVDTGSTDATVEIARSFGARVLFHEWTGSFAQARNVSFEAADGDWLIYLDADEVLVEEDIPLLRSLTGRTWREAFYLSETNHTGDLDDGTAVCHNALRVFRNRPEYRFEGRLHEQIAPRLPGYLPERLEASGVRIDHYGYLGVVRDSREKSRRNIELLRMQQAEGPPTPFLHYNLGSEYAAANEPAAALVEFERAWELLESLPDRESYEFAPALMNRMVKALRACGRPADAIARAEEGIERFEGFTDLVFEQAVAAIALGQDERASVLLERCIEMGDAPSRYTATVGCGTFLAMVQLAELGRAAGDHAGATRLLERCLREHPQFPGAVLPYASALLATGVAPERVIAKIERHVWSLSPTARFILATALYEAGATDAGRSVLGALEAMSPGIEMVPLLATLLEAVLRAQDFDAFEQVHALLAGTPIRARERRQLLAEMYLRHGFLVSAAQEWMAVCEQEPDVQALLGLARVAAARGLPREMSDFAAAALSRDPDNEDAASLLSQAHVATA
jgi:glycosyltransferase involved in cell wall biosynthesis